MHFKPARSILLLVCAFFIAGHPRAVMAQSVRGGSVPIQTAPRTSNPIVPYYDYLPMLKLAGPNGLPGAPSSWTQKQIDGANKIITEKVVNFDAAFRLAYSEPTRAADGPYKGSITMHAGSNISPGLDGIFSSHFNEDQLASLRKQRVGSDIWIKGTIARTTFLHQNKLLIFDVDLVNCKIYDKTVQPMSGVVMHARFDAESVNVQKKSIVEMSTAHRPGSFDNCELITDPDLGSVAGCNGLNSQITFARNTAFQMNNQLTLAALVKSTRADGNQTLIANDDWDGSATNGYVLRLADGKPDFNIGVNGWQEVKASDNLKLNTWHLLAATYDGSFMKLYVDGREVAARPMTGRISPSKYALGIGNDTFDITRRFTGNIAQAWLCNKAMESETLATLAADVPAP